MAAVGRESPLKGSNADSGSEVELEGKVGPNTEKVSGSPHRGLSSSSSPPWLQRRHQQGPNPTTNSKPFRERAPEILMGSGGRQSCHRRE